MASQGFLGCLILVTRGDIILLSSSSPGRNTFRVISVIVTKEAAKGIKLGAIYRFSLGLSPCPCSCTSVCDSLQAGQPPALSWRRIDGWDVGLPGMLLSRVAGSGVGVPTLPLRLVWTTTGLHRAVS